MTQPVLPHALREKIISLFKEGLSSVEVFDAIIDEATQYVDSYEQLVMCIASLKGKIALRKAGEEPNENPEISIPRPIKFDVNRHQGIIEQLSTTMMEKAFENLCQDIILDILKNYEGFSGIENANAAAGFHNPPFDFFAFKDSMPYIIETKSSLNNFIAPGETQKRRLKEVMDAVEGLNISILQIRLNSGEYRIFYNEETDQFFDGRRVPVEPVVAWLKMKIDRGRQGKQ